MILGSVWPMMMGGSECGDVVANASHKIASPNITALAAGASWPGVVFAAVIAPGWKFEWLSLSWWNFETCCCCCLRQRRGQGAICQHDNATPHTCHVSRTFLQQQNVHVLDGPAKSPDRFPIEHVWDVLGRRVRRRRHQPTNLQELAQALTEEWDNFPANVIRRFIGSIRRRCNAVIQPNGGHTRY